MHNSINIRKAGFFLLLFSIYLLAICVPISIAGDNIAIGIGIAGLLLMLLSGDYKKFPPIKPLLFFLLPPLLTIIIQVNPAFLRCSSIRQHILPYFQVFKVLREKNVLNRILILLGLSTILLFLSLLFTALTWQSVKHINFNSLMLHNHLAIAKGFLGHHLTTASVLTLILFLFFGFFLKERKTFYLVIVVVSTFGLILTQARSAWLGLIAGFFIVSLLVVKNKKQFFVILLVIISFFISISFITTLRVRFLSSFNPNASYSNIDRLSLWDSYIISFKRYSLKQKLFGAGTKTREYIKRNFVDSFKYITGTKIDSSILKNHFHGGAAHNIYLRYLGEVGVVGLLGYVLFWLYVLRINLIKAKDSVYRNVFISLSGGYISFLVIGFFEDNFVDATVKIALMFILGINFYLLQADKTNITPKDKLRDNYENTY